MVTSHTLLVSSHIAISWVEKIYACEHTFIEGINNIVNNWMDRKGLSIIANVSVYKPNSVTVWPLALITKTNIHLIIPDMVYSVKEI